MGIKDPISAHEDLTSALIANVLDMPSILGVPEIASIRASDLYVSFQPVWHTLVGLHKNNNVSVTALVAALPPNEFYTLDYFNRLRNLYRGTNLDDLKGIAASLRNHSSKVQMRNDAGWLAGESSNGRDARAIARDMIERLTPIALEGKHTFSRVGDVLSEVYDEIVERSKNPNVIWGIPYPYYPFLGKITGGKQPGELTMFTGEPKVGKSWWVDQDAMGTALAGVPTAIWCGEMKKKQIVRRLLQLQGLNGRRAKTGYINSTDWEKLNHAIEALEPIPLFLEDSRVNIDDLLPIFMQLKNEHGIQHVVLDYAYLIGAKGKDETERTGMVSAEAKRVVQEAEMSCTLITSVNKLGMDVPGKNVLKSNIRGSGQQIHDADVILSLTKFAPVDGDEEDLRIKPAEYDKYATLHILGGRELDENIPGGCIHYKREGTPFFVECKKYSDCEPDLDAVENWMKYTGDD